MLVALLLIKWGERLGPVHWPGPSASARYAFIHLEESASQELLVPVEPAGPHAEPLSLAEGYAARHRKRFVIPPGLTG